VTEHLGSIAEIVAATGMAKQTVHNWTTRGIVGAPKFPAPVSTLASGRVWDLNVVRVWVLDRGFTWKDAGHA
jgi:predicted DNA-binding transcriptional regulator AlpA